MLVRSCILNLSSLGDSHQPETMLFCFMPQTKRKPLKQPSLDPMLLSSCSSLFLFVFTARLLESIESPHRLHPHNLCSTCSPQLTWFPAEASIRTALVKLVIQSSADLISVDTSLLKTCFPLASVTCHSPGFFSYFSDRFCLGFFYQQLLYLISLVGTTQSSVLDILLILCSFLKKLHLLL